MYLSVAVTKTTTSHPFLHTNSSSSTPSSVTKVCLLLLSTDSTNGLPPPPPNKMVRYKWSKSWSKTILKKKCPKIAFQFDHKY